MRSCIVPKGKRNHFRRLSVTFGGAINRIYVCMPRRGRVEIVYARALCKTYFYSIRGRPWRPKKRIFFLPNAKRWRVVAGEGHRVPRRRSSCVRADGGGAQSDHSYFSSRSRVYPSVTCRLSYALFSRPTFVVWYTLIILYKLW